MQIRKDQAHARRTDPETSHEAAAGIDVKKNQKHVLDVLRVIAPCTDEMLVYSYPNYKPNDEQSPSGIRSRRHELVERGLVEWSGRWHDGSGGRRKRIWALTEKGK